MLNGKLSDFKALSDTSGSFQRDVSSSRVRIARKVKGRVGIGDLKQRHRNRNRNRKRKRKRKRKRDS